MLHPNFSAQDPISFDREARSSYIGEDTVACYPAGSVAEYLLIL